MTVLFIQAESTLLNPSLDQAVIQAAYADDPEAARSEWGGNFRADVSQWLPDDVIDRALRPGCRSRPRASDCTYVGFVDSSGGVHDNMTMSVAHQEAGGRVVLDKLLVREPPFKPEDVVEEFCTAFSAYGVNTVTGDRYGAEWVSSAFAKHGVNYKPAGSDKSQIYNESAPLFTQGLVDLLDVPLLETELRLLERRPRTGGRPDSIDHPPRAHDDAANAACGALWLASKQRWTGRAVEYLSGFDPLRHGNAQWVAKHVSNLNADDPYRATNYDPFRGADT